jgi:putative addiction module component (TIGR02574 family)
MCTPMTTQTQAILDAALALPEAERLALMEQLLEVSSPDLEELNDDELYAELERRRAEVHAGTAKGIPWSELKSRE